MSTNYSDLIPVLSDDVEYNRLTENEFILSNRTHRHYLKINNKVYNLLCQVDGKKTLNELSQSFFDSFGEKINVVTIHDLLYEKLSMYGILEGMTEKIKGYEKPSYLNLSFIIFPEKIVHKLTSKLHFLFERKYVILILCLSTAIISSLLFFNYSLFESFNLQNSMIYFFSVMASSVTFHELGHATAASYYGAKHGGIGGGFYLFTPVYYADVTDIWRLSKRQRIIVNISGMYFELVFCSILCLIAFLLGNNILLLVAITVCLYTLFNLNPFLRSDGYWVLSDLTNKPNLFFHSANKVKDIFKFIFLRKRIQWKVKDVFLFAYGSVSFVFIGLFLYYVLIENPNSLLDFPKNAYNFLRSLFDPSSEFSLIKYGELIVPLMFYSLIIKLCFGSIRKQIAKMKLLS
ncbi:peptidase, M50 family protein [Maribacter sp. MJ134]|uniref:peptidase, M50 family protein n=1 Tax=Maribacter sp. MJ134 TaxID=2496865 RepID=UPI000F82C079|nr:peptidase, M50 family protein [Maribacter sp. MJ134]AZQ59888.1 peptidase, M50 family protein [Maribacter sp. MJ134]